MKRKEKSFKKQKTQRPFKTMSYASGFSIPNSFRSADKFKVSNAVRKKIQELQLVGITPLEYTSPYYHSEQRSSSNNSSREWSRFTIHN
jgi:hypothetical protein